MLFCSVGTVAPLREHTSTLAPLQKASDALNPKIAKLINEIQQQNLKKIAKQINKIDKHHFFANFTFDMYFFNSYRADLQVRAAFQAVTMQKLTVSELSAEGAIS
jgi:hypothetical protein